jgi:glycosyltransferase involved in cell wall biosynthesis
MKYYPRQTGRIVDWAGGPRTKGKYFLYRGEKFLQLPVLKLGNRVVNDNGPLEHKSKKLIFIGSISRPEKISNNDYNSIINSVLNQLPNARYLYAGREEQIHLIPEFIRDNRQACHIGWVDPLEAIKKYDIYIDPFPWGGGDMTFLAMCNDLPYLILDNKENMEIGITGSIRIIAEQGDPILEYSFCKSKEELEKKIIYLCENKEFRTRLGKAWGEACNNYHPAYTEEWMKFLSSRNPS